VENHNDFLTGLATKKSTGLTTSINDLRDKEFSGNKLSADEKKALANFDRYRINILNAQAEEEKFHYTYRQLQVIANLSDWREFLKAEFQS
jgi:sulfur relay (sulfurtransferase) DsrC/TusE family protein